MPLRIKCRCGQDLVLRYSEWVYVLVGLSIAGFLANLLIVLALLARVSELEESLTKPEEAPAEERRLVRLDRPAPPADEPPPGPPPEEPRPTSPPKEPTESPVDGDSIDPRPPPPWKPSQQLRPLGSPSSTDFSSATSRDELLAEIERQLAAEPDEPSADSGAPRRRSGAVDETEPETRRLVDAAPLTRLMLLEESTSFAAITAGFLLDPELRIARRAAVLLTTQTRPRGSTRDSIAPLIDVGIRRLRGLPEGERLARELDVGSATASTPAREELESAWNVARTSSEGMIGRLALASRIDRFLADAKSDGADVLLAVDTTRSMSPGLSDLKRSLGWILPALEWGAPGVRIGLLLYKDEVVGVEDFSSTPAQRILPLILDLEAEGGGDVPEGVDKALRAALELGRFAWRENASKHVLFIGDAPPPYPALRELKSLLAACRREGGFRVHALGVYPKEGETVPFFADLAREGGGRGPTCKAGELGTELLFCLLGEESPGTVRRIQERAQEEFSRGL